MTRLLVAGFNKDQEKVAASFPKVRDKSTRTNFNVHGKC